MRDITFKVGDKIRIRQWNDMEKEFPITSDFIPCAYGFIEEMETYCGMDFVIKSISGQIVLFNDMSEDMKGFTWSTDMIEPYSEPHIPDDLEFSYGDMFS